MASKKVWNLMYRAGTQGRIISAGDNPVTRKEALAGAAAVTKNGWRVWVEHHITRQIILQNPAELKYLANRFEQLANQITYGCVTTVEAEGYTYLEGKTVTDIKAAQKKAFSTGPFKTESHLQRFAEGLTKVVVLQNTPGKA
jgi:hypothetical protein